MQRFTETRSGERSDSHPVNVKKEWQNNARYYHQRSPVQRAGRSEPACGHGCRNVKNEREMKTQI